MTIVATTTTTTSTADSTTTVTVTTISTITTTTASKYSFGYFDAGSVYYFPLFLINECNLVGRLLLERK
jgi:hypothetical protein